MIRCPHCQSSLSWWQLRARFQCRRCDASLQAELARPTIAALAMWVLADIPLSLGVAFVAGESWGATLLRVALSGAFGGLVLHFMFGYFARIATAAADSSR